VGGFLPILASLVTVDLAPIIDNASELTVGNYCGYAIRVVGLLLLGGVVAILNSDVRQPLALVQLGIAAPALVTAYINSKPPLPQSPRASFSIISSAHASDAEPRIQVAGFLGDVRRSIGQPLPNVAVQNSARQSPVYPSSPAPANESGAYCATSSGRYGPGPMNQVGSTCVIQAPGGPIQGVVTR
jgi:hypothetical protein